MAAFRFALEKVLEHRRRVVDLRARDLAAAEGRVAVLAARLAEVRREQERCTAAPDDGRLDVSRLAGRTAWIARLDGIAAALEADRAAAAEAAQAARAALQAAWRDREVLDQLRARRQQEWQVAQGRRETRELDEIGAQRSARGA